MAIMAPNNSAFKEELILMLKLTYITGGKDLLTLKKNTQ
jgi:hypothetical protein